MSDAPVVGVIGRDVPLELIDAAGAVPRVLRGDPRADISFAEEVLGRGLDPAGTHLLGGLLAGGFTTLTAIACCSDSDLSLRLYYALRELARRMPELPPVHLVDVLHLRRAASTEYDRRQLHAFRRALASWTGIAADADALATAIDERRRIREGLAVLAVRRPAEGERAFTSAVRAAGTLPASAALARVEDALREPSPAAGAGLPVVLTGSADLGSGTAAALERAGLRVVGDDLPDGEAGLDVPIGGSTLDDLALRARDDAATPHRAASPERARRLQALVAERGAAAVVAVIRARDEAPLWDLGAQRAQVGVPLVVLRDQPFGEVDAQALTHALHDLRVAS